MAVTAGDRHIVYEALAGLFAPPTSELLEFVGSESFINGLSASVEKLGGAGHSAVVHNLAEAARETDLRTIEVEYTRLFMGPGMPVAPPLESAWISEEMEEQGVVPIRVVESVNAAYAFAGFALEPGPEPADYLGAELDFLAQLAERAEADGGGQAAGLHDAFLSEHFRAWAPRLAETVARETTLPFYRAAARLLAMTCE